jgi:DNA repair protein RadC
MAERREACSGRTDSGGFADRRCTAASAREGAASRLLRDGEASLSDEDLLSVMLGGGGERRAGEVARGLLEIEGSLRRLGRLSARELLERPGVGSARAARILGLFALVRRIGEETLHPGTSVRSSRELFRYFNRKLRDRKREEFIAVLLDGKNRILREETISLGSLTASIVHPREVFLPAVRESAGSVILVHNHPSGDPAPSPEDVEVTRRLVRAGEVLGIRVLDHVIIGERGYTSLLDRGVLTP